MTDGEAVYGFGRNNYQIHGSHPRLGQTQYHLFSADVTAASLEPSDAETRVPQSADLHWSVKVPLLAQAMVLTGRTLWIAGPPDLPGLAEAAASLDGQRGGMLQAVSAQDGKKLADYRLSSPPVFDGMAVAAGQLFLSLRDGHVVSFKTQ